MVVLSGCWRRCLGFEERLKGPSFTGGRIVFAAVRPCSAGLPGGLRVAAQAVNEDNAFEISMMGNTMAYMCLYFTR